MSKLNPMNQGLFSTWADDTSVTCLGFLYYYQRWLFLKSALLTVGKTLLFLESNEKNVQIMSSKWKLLGKGGNVHVKYATNSNMLLNVSSNLWVPEKKITKIWIL